MQFNAIYQTKNSFIVKYNDNLSIVISASYKSYPLGQEKYTIEEMLCDFIEMKKWKKNSLEEIFGDLMEAKKIWIKGFNRNPYDNLNDVYWDETQIGLDDDGYSVFILVPENKEKEFYQYQSSVMIPC